MFKHHFYIALFLFLAAHAISQVSSKKNTIVLPDTVYSHAIQYFLLDDLSFAYKINSHYPTVWAFRFDISGSTENRSFYSESFNQNSTMVSESEGTYNGQQFKIQFAVLYNYYFTLNRHFKPYLGIGPQLSYAYNDYENEYSNSTHLHTSFTKTYTSGLLAVCGVESSFLDFISFFIEYNLAYAYKLARSEHSEYIPIDVLQSRHKSTSHTYVLKLSNAKIGIVLYF